MLEEQKVSTSEKSFSFVPKDLDDYVFEITQKYIVEKDENGNNVGKLVVMLKTVNADGSIENVRLTGLKILA